MLGFLNGRCVFTVLPTALLLSSSILPHVYTWDLAMPDYTDTAVTDKSNFKKPGENVLLNVH